MSKLERIAIVGGSLAGLRAAEALRERGFEGSLVFIGEEPYEPYDRPPLSKDVIRGDWGPEKTSLVRGDSFRDLDLDLRLGRRATSLDAQARQIVLDDDERIGFDGLLIATGARPRSLPGTPALEGIHTLRRLEDALAIRAGLERGPRVAVVGAGFIGAEVAASCRKLGLEVTMIEAMPVPLEHALGGDVGGTLADAHRDQGVDVRLGVGVEGFDGETRVEGIRLVDGTRVAADLVVVGIGAAPETAWLEGSGIALDGGVVCDATCATSLPGVVAAGDVARWHNPAYDETMRIEHWTNAAEMGRAAALRLLAGDGDAEPYASIPFVWSDQYDLKIQSAGMCAASDQSQVVIGSLAERKFVKLYGRKGRLAGALAFGEPRRLMGFRRLLRESATWDEAVASAES